MTKFADRNFKRVLLLQLSASSGDDPELDAVVSETADEDAESDDIHRDILKLLDSRKPSDATLAAFREFSMEVYMQAIGTVLPGWSGEEDPLPIESFADLAKLPNLEVFDYPVSHDYVIEPEQLLALPKLKRVRIYNPPNDKAVAALLAAGFKRKKGSDDRVPELER
jgi:hypothetical protein